MAKRGKKPCAYPGCPNLTTRTYCSVHQTKITKRYDESRGTSTERGYDSNWKKTSDAHLKKYPFCSKCEEPAVDVDHIIPKDRGGKDIKINLQSLCKSCHNKKTAEESDNFQRSNFGTASIMLVCGPPGAGKTTWVIERMRWGDVVADYDLIVKAISGQSPKETPLGIRRIARAAYHTTIQTAIKHDLNLYIITTAPTHAKRKTLLGSIKPDRTFVFEPTPLECLRRIRKDKDRTGDVEHWRRILLSWNKYYERPKDGERISL